MNLPLKFGIGMNLVRHGNSPTEGSSSESNWQSHPKLSSAVVLQLLRVRGNFDCYSGGDPRSLLRGRVHPQIPAAVSTLCYTPPRTNAHVSRSSASSSKLGPRCS